MNSIEWQVTGLDLSRKLKELGVKQESVFYWMEYLTSNGTDWKNRVPSGKIEVRYPDGSNPSYWDFDNKISAFTVAELYQIIYDYGYDFGIPNKFDPKAIPIYMASFLVLSLEESGSVKP